MTKAAVTIHNLKQVYKSKLFDFEVFYVIFNSIWIHTYPFFEQYFLMFWKLISSSTIRKQFIERIQTSLVAIEFTL